MSTHADVPDAARRLAGGMSATTHGTETTAPDDAWANPVVAPLVSTLVTVPVAWITHFILALMPMACDSCTQEEADRFEPSFDIALWVFRSGLLVAAGLLLTACLLPAKRRFVEPRRFLAVLAPVSVVLFLLAACTFLDLPD